MLGERDLVPVAGFRIDGWIDLWSTSHARINGAKGSGIVIPPSVRRIAWPDGGAYLEQENVLVEIFRVVEAEWFRVELRRLKRRGR